MSHELRTPLNSLLVLAEQLEDNPDGNLTERQVQYAHVIRSSGGDLLKLLNDILDLAKVESNTVHLEIGELSLAELRDSMLQTFQPDRRGAGPGVLGRARRAAAGDDDHRSASPPAGAQEPAVQRVQVHRARRGRCGCAARGLEPATAARQADSVIAISVTRHRDRHQGESCTSAMFEAFAQADGIDRPQVRRHRARALDQPQPRRPARRRDHAGERARAGQHLHRLPPAGSAPPRHRAPQATNGDAGARSARRRRQRRGRRPTAEVAGRSSTTGSAAGTTVLIVDDDFRNIFALTALLERGKAERRRGRERRGGARRSSTQRTDIDLVLMDIMMPVMNGYETMAAIRARPALADLPIIAVTGKVGRRRARALPRRRRVGLHPEAGRHGGAAGGAEPVVPAPTPPHAPVPR